MRLYHVSVLVDIGIKRYEKIVFLIELKKVYVVRGLVVIRWEFSIMKTSVGKEDRAAIVWSKADLDIHCC